MTKAQRNPKVQFPIGGGRGDDSQNLRLKDYQTGRGNALVGGGGEFWWDVWLSVGLLRDVARPGKVAEEFVRSWASRGGLWCWTLGLVTRNNSAKARKGNALKFKLFKFAGAVLLLIVLAVTLAVWNYRFCSRYVRLPGLNLLFMGCFSRSAFTHLNKGEWDAAIADFTNAIRVDGESGLVDAEWAGRGMAYDGKHEWDKAIGDLTEAIKRNAQTTAAYEYRAEAYGEKRE